MITKNEIANAIRSKQVQQISSDGWAEPTILFTSNEPVVNLLFPDTWKCRYELRYSVMLTVPDYKDSWEQAHRQAVNQIHNELYGGIIGELAQIQNMLRFSPKVKIEDLIDNLLKRLKDAK